MALSQSEFEKLKQQMAGGASSKTQTLDSVIANVVAKPRQTPSEGFFTPIKDIKETGSEIGSQLKERMTNIGESATAMQKKEQGFLSTLFQGAGQVAGGIADTVGSAIKGVAKVITPEPVEKVAGKAVEAGAEAVMGTDVAQKLVGWYDTLDPETKRNVDATLGLGSLATTVGTGGLAKEPVKAVGKQALKQGEKLLAKGKKAISMTPEKKALTAIEDVTPTRATLTKTERLAKTSQLDEKGNYIPTEFETKAGAVLNSIPDYNPKSTILQKAKVVNNEIPKRGSLLESKLDAENIIVPRKETFSLIKNNLNELKKTSLLLEKTDPVINKYLNATKNALNNTEGSLGGVYRLKKTLDSIYKNAKGKKAFGDKVAALDEVHDTVVETLKNVLITRAKNVDVQKEIDDLWSLYRAQKILNRKADLEPRSKFGRLKQRFPKTTKTVKAVGNLTGIGGAIGTGAALLD